VAPGVARPITHGCFGAREAGSGLGLAVVDNPERSEPYIYHFPDGNASLARLLVRSLLRR
jgi:spermidine dehydrogenase